jgi:hypothetical protein
LRPTDAAIERLSRPEYQRQMREFRNDHRDHTQVLGTWLREHGHTPPDSGGAKELLTKGKVVIAGLAGDKQVLQAMKTNEDDTNTAYERAIKHEEAGDLVTAFERTCLTSAAIVRGSRLPSRRSELRFGGSCHDAASSPVAGPHTASV